MALVTDQRGRFRLTYGESASPATEIPTPLLGGAAYEDILGGAEPMGTESGFTLFGQRGWLGGIARAVLPSTKELEATAFDLYRRLFAVVGPHHLARVWNYVPAINEIGAQGLENYRAFCRGRSVAFETTYGHEFTRRLPAASAVGIDRCECIIVFLASESLPRHYENPHQTPAYLYPLEHGPKSPSFARASVVTTKTAITHFISGTAAIRGHLSIAPHDTAAQTACTVSNLRGISNACGLGEDLGRSTATHRSFKVYLRHAADYAPVARFLGANLLNVRDSVTYLQADICRRELNVEIEAIATTSVRR